MTGQYAQLVGSGAIQSDIVDGYGAVHVGPTSQSSPETIQFWLIDGIQIVGPQLAGDGSIGIYVNSSEPVSGGNNYQGTIKSVRTQGFDEHIHLDEICNGHNIYDIQSTYVGRYWMRFVGGTHSLGEIAIFGGFVSASASSITMLKVENGHYIQFHGINAEPGGTAKLFDFDSNSSWLQLYGHNNCSSASIDNSIQSVIIANGAGVTTAGTDTFLITDGTLLTPPIVLGSGKFLTTKVQGFATKISQIGQIVGGSSGAVYLGDITPTLYNYSLASDGATFTAINVISGGLGYLRNNNSSTAEWSDSQFMMVRGQRVNITSTSISYLVLSSDYIINVTGVAGPVTITLPASPSSGDMYIVKDGGGTAAIHNITISGNGHNIDNASTALIDQNYASITFVFTGSIWSII